MPTTYIIRSRINGDNYVKMIPPIPGDPNPQPHIYKWCKYEQSPTQFEFASLAHIFALACDIKTYDVVPHKPYNDTGEVDATCSAESDKTA